MIYIRGKICVRPATKTTKNNAGKSLNQSINQSVLFQAARPIETNRTTHTRRQVLTDEQ